MPSPLTELISIGQSAVLVAVCVSPLAIIARGFTRTARPIYPRYRKCYSRWLGIDVAMLALFCLLFRDVVAMLLEPSGLLGFLNVPVDASAIERSQSNYQKSTIIGLLSLPFIAYGFLHWKRFTAAERLVVPSRFSADIVLGIMAWAVVAPLTLIVHFGVNVIFHELGLSIDDHPLKNMKLTSGRDVALFLAGACVVAPVFEELGYRRILVPWAARKNQRSWIVLALALCGSILFANGSSRFGPPIFIGAVALAMGILEWYSIRSPRFRLRPNLALLSSAALFAIIHSGVWPTPIPLFVLGIGLGWLVLRTRTILPAVIAHGLFNLISVIYLLRGGT